MRAVALLLILLLLVPAPAPAGETRPVRLRWEDIGGLVRGKKVTVVTNDGRESKGRVRAVEAGGITLENRPPIGRESVAEIRVVDYVGNGRHRGKFLGGVVGLLVGLSGAAAIGLKEGSADNAVDKAAAIILGVGGLPLGLLIGWLAGRQVDKEVTVIRIIR